MRYGQAAFNVLMDLYPDLAKKIRGTSLDPFYNEIAVPAFLEWVKEHLP